MSDNFEREFTGSEVTPQMYIINEKVNPGELLKVIENLITDLKTEGIADNDRIWSDIKQKLGILIEFLRKDSLSKEELAQIVDEFMQISEQYDNNRKNNIEGNETVSFINSQIVTDLNSLVQSIKDIKDSNIARREARKSAVLLDEILKIYKEKGDHLSLLIVYVKNFFEKLEVFSEINSPYQLKLSKDLIRHKFTKELWNSMSPNKSDEKKLHIAIPALKELLNEMELLFNTDYKMVKAIDRSLRKEQ